ncbi:hypothetical protein IC006_0346 [Sulfuracidifex tepidarius]|uniref:Uncharacterized protein n=1 Tax=Sulfuracidifex tepidarius TaxID=1294262 RepID=A0A510DSA9_9CREN|nr:hypothetical protein [Sulfuracidifex tepidarius]BBG23062.1 hypothetical protein IC006_0346 [Sulfuracidifex tepidarius]
MVSLVTLVVIASLMVLAIIGVIYFVERKMQTYTHVFMAEFFMLMMATMFVGAMIYLYNPSTFSLGIGVGINMVSMIIALAAFFSVVDNLSRPIKDKRIFPLISLSIVIDEILMGSTFQLAESGKFVSPIQGIDSSLNSVWFFYPMMTEMLFLFLVKLNGLSGNKLPLYLLPVIVVTAMPPTLLQVPLWRYYSIFIDIAFLGYGMISSSIPSWRVLYALIGIGIVSTFLGTGIPFGISLSVSMIYYYYSIFSSSKKEISDKIVKESR